MKRTLIQTTLAAALLLGLSHAASANGINSPSGVNVEIGAGGSPNIITVTQAGQVGINNTLPGAGYALDVNGDTNIGGNLYVTGQQNTGNRIFMQRDGSNYSWIGAQGTGTDAERDAIGFLSEADTGKIDEVFTNTNMAVGGSVKIGNDASDCTSANAGAIRWNRTTFESCNGAAWRPLAGNWIPAPAFRSYQDYPVDSTGTTSLRATYTLQYGTVADFNNYSPSAWCQQHGYQSATGSCRGVYPSPAFDYEGMLTANDSAGSWTYACVFGIVDYWMDSNTQIQCQ